MSAPRAPCCPATGWLGVGRRGLCFANGEEGKCTCLFPDLELIIEGKGRKGAAVKGAVKGWMGEMAEDFRSGA